MKYIHRDIDGILQEWARRENQKPLLLRGARQVGKTSAVRELSKKFTYFIEVDMNEPGPVPKLLESDVSTEALWESLCGVFGIPNRPDDTLLFLDEIQASPAAINRLRYFHEKLPALHVIAAGTMLEFVLEDLPSFGVGRVRSLFLYPMSFGEFLEAQGKESWRTMLEKAGPEAPLPEAVHDVLIGRLRTFLAVGGMPEAVSTYCETHDLLACQHVLDSLIASYQNDFKKYSKRLAGERIAEVFKSIAEQGQGKFIYSKVGASLKPQTVKNALRMLVLAGLVHPVTHAAVDHLPIGSGADEKHRRMILLDAGLAQRLLNLPLSDLLLGTDLRAGSLGAIAEAFAGMELLKASDPCRPQSLYCWHGETRGSQAEVDYVVQRGREIIPIEVKSGGRGSQQSLRLFLKLKELPWGVRAALENFSARGNVRIYPLYAIANLIRSASL